MKSCPEFQSYIHPYVDGELAAPEQMGFEEHLLQCDRCRAEYDRVRHVVDIVRGSRPLYPLPPNLFLAVQAILQGDRSRNRKQRSVRFAAMACGFAATLLLVALLPTRLSQSFTSFAAETHLRYAQGALPLSVSSEEPSIVSSFLQAHLPFHLSLPNFPAEAGISKSYSLVGAKLLQFGGKDVAYLAYTMAEHPISLLVSSSADVIPSGGDVYTSGKLMFHFSSERGLKLITWRDRGLSYALVSDVHVGGAESCVVCHGSERERRKFENLLRTPVKRSKAGVMDLLHEGSTPASSEQRTIDSR
jgi:anti-sigma factor RsiW